jgi:hypothetical protein
MLLNKGSAGGGFGKEAPVLRKARAASMVEYVVLIVLVITLVGIALLGLAGTIYNKLETVNVDLGS